jgi:hypothetical protein
MWQEWTAKITLNGEELYIVLIQDISLHNQPNALRCELMCNRNHLSSERETLWQREFADVTEAKTYCEMEYGIRDADWQDKITQPYRFQFDYEITNLGVPQPIPVGFDNGRLLICFANREDENGAVRQALNICGTRDGLKHLAAMCLLCADSEQYDPAFYIHLEDMINVETDIEITIRSPNYLEVLGSRQFSDFKGTAISVSENDFEEQSSGNDLKPLK